MEDNIVDIEDYSSFNLNKSSEAIDFLILIVTVERIYPINTRSIYSHIKKMNFNEYMQSNKNDNFSIDSMLVCADFFNNYLNTNPYENHFYDYLICNNEISDTIKKSKIRSLLIGIKKYTDYLWKHEVVSTIDYHFNNDKDNFIDIVRESQLLSYSLPSYWIYINVELIYNYILEQYPLFIEKDSLANIHIEKAKESLDELSNQKQKFARVKLLDELLKNNVISIFEKYEVELVLNGFLNNKKNLWLGSPASLIRFYSYCEEKRLFKDSYIENSKGVKIIRKLYNFHNGTDIDKPSKRKKQLNKKEKHQFIFLNKNSPYSFQ